MKTYIMRIFLENGMVVDKLSSTNDRDAHIKEYLERGLRTTDGTCLLIYPARLIERIECYEQGSAPPIGKKDRKPSPKRVVRRPTLATSRDDAE